MKTLTFVIFGGTGDLAKKKLGNAIAEFAKKNKHLKINLIGTGRSHYTNKTYKTLLETNEKKFVFPSNVIVRYFKADVSILDSFENFEKYISIKEKEVEGRMFYLATDSKFFEPITKIILKIKKIGFSRVLFEKPFGYDTKSSKELNACLHKVFSEEEIFRVDHYLAKETVNNILTMRFSNPIFENTWNSKFIQRIKISVSENFGVGNRLHYYNDSGAIKDMLQNHLFQVLLFILMEPPKYVSSEKIAKEKYLSAKKLDYSGKLIIGQYEGYQAELNSAKLPDKKTETYAQIHLKSKQKRWKGTDIVLKTGKYMSEREAHISIEYKKEPCILFCSHDTVPNKLIFRIQPTQDVEFTMNATKPGENPDILPVRMTFCKECVFKANTIESYETIISESYKGEKRLFINENILNESWRVIDKVLKVKSNTELKLYEKGSNGPEE